MNRMSLKLKLTILYTFFMVLVISAALMILFSLSSREVLSSVQSRLESRVQESVEEIDLENGELVIGPDFYSVLKDVYLSVYDANMYFLYGRIPPGFNSQPEFSDGQIRRIADEGKEWYVYDLSFRLDKNNTVYIRGITSVTDAEESFAVTVRFALVILPLLAIVTAFIGYRFTRRTLLPVRKITQTVQAIRNDADLSKRVGLSAGKKRGDEISELAETFDSMLEELDKAFAREKQFTTDASHELRTPVSVILAQCAECLEEENLPEKQRRQILLIRKKAGEMAGMISQLLLLSRSDESGILSRERINASGLTLTAAEEQQMLADIAGKKIRIDCRIEPDISVIADETLYIRMVVNLLSNAVRYTGDNGTVTVRLWKEGEMLKFEVSDTGIGIREEELPRIWERFYRTDQSRSAGGSGLGLSMVRWIAEAHGGSVGAESVFGKGSTFRFSIPLDGKK